MLRCRWQRSPALGVQELCRRLIAQCIADAPLRPGSLASRRDGRLRSMLR